LKKLKIMNYKKIVLGLGIATSLFAIQSCDKIKDFKNLNTNPNATTTPIPAALLTNVEAGMGANLVFDAGGINTGAGLYAQYFSETQYTEVSRYNKPNYNYDGYFVGPIEDLQTIINYNSDPATAGAAANYGSNKNQIAIARILKAHYVKFLTDAVGDLPYFNALKGNAGVISAPYDKQQDIYKDLLKELKEAVDQFDNGTTVQGDIIFGGNVAQWKKYANSLRLLLALNMAKADAATGKTEFAAALAHSAGVISSNSDNVTINYIGGNFPNPFYNYYVLTQRLDFGVSKTMTDQLSSTSDPRLGVFATSGKGFPYGLTRDNAIAFASANADWARITKPAPSDPDHVYQKQDAPLVIIGAANIYLARAEAAQRGWTSEDVTTMFSNGVQASFAQWGVTGTTPAGPYDLQKIATQEWLAWFPNGLEGWNVWRRTGYPTLTPAPGLTTIPRRDPYGTNDYAYNSANVTDAAARYTVNGIVDSQYGKIWWDQ
jgi:hypothetical protein